MKVKLKEKKLLRRLCPTFIPSITWIQADHAMDIDNETRICLNSSNTRDKTQQNYDRLNYKMYYKAVIIHKNRIFPYFQNKVENLNK